MYDTLNLRVRIRLDDNIVYNIVLVDTIQQEEVERKENLNIRTQIASNYLIDLYKNTTKKFSCNSTKLGKLLSIAYFICAKNNKKLFNDAIISGRCGTSIVNFSYCCTAELNTTENDDINSSIDISEVSFDRTLVKASQVSLTENVRNLLYDIFLRFGAYSARQLGELIDDFKQELLDTEQNTNTVAFELAKKYFNKTQFEDEKNLNELDAYIRNYNLFL